MLSSFAGGGSGSNSHAGSRGNSPFLPAEGGAGVGAAGSAPFFRLPEAAQVPSQQPELQHPNDIQASLAAVAALLPEGAAASQGGRGGGGAAGGGVQGCGRNVLQLCEVLRALLPGLEEVGRELEGEAEVVGGEERGAVGARARGFGTVLRQLR